MPATRGEASCLSETFAAPYWPSRSIVNVYFVHDVFTDAERQTLWVAIETWRQTVKRMGSEISFVAAGETAGLIDCSGCLTITRKGANTRKSKERVSFNALRQDAAGKVFSAWVSFEYESSKSQTLTPLMHQALDRGFAVGVAQSLCPEPINKANVGSFPSRADASR